MFNSMNPKALFGIGLVATSAIALSASPAQALIITTQENTPFSTVEGAQTITFDDAPLRDSSLGSNRGGVDYTDPTSGISYYGIGGDFAQNYLQAPGTVAAPLPNQPGEYDNRNNTYLTVGSLGNTANDKVTINLMDDADYFGFYFGSIDWYNNITFKKGGEIVKAIDGVDILGQALGFSQEYLDGLTHEQRRELANGNRSANGARFVNIFADEEGEFFDSVEFQSSGIAFETDNHAYRLAAPEVVPTPAAVLPILSGLFAAAKRRKQDEVAE